MNKGYVDQPLFSLIFRKYGFEVSNNDLFFLMVRLDRDGDGVVAFNDYKDIFYPNYFKVYKKTTSSNNFSPKTEKIIGMYKKKDLIPGSGSSQKRLRPASSSAIRYPNYNKNYNSQISSMSTTAGKIKSQLSQTQLTRSNSNLKNKFSNTSISLGETLKSNKMRESNNSNNNNNSNYNLLKQTSKSIEMKYISKPNLNDLRVSNSSNLGSLGMSPSRSNSNLKVDRMILEKEKSPYRHMQSYESVNQNNVYVRNSPMKNLNLNSNSPVRNTSASPIRDRLNNSQLNNSNLGSPVRNNLENLKYSSPVRNNLNNKSSPIKKVINNADNINYKGSPIREKPSNEKIDRMIDIKTNSPERKVNSSTNLNNKNSNITNDLNNHLYYDQKSILKGTSLTNISYIPRSPSKFKFETHHTDYLSRFLCDLVKYDCDLETIKEALSLRKDLNLNNMFYWFDYSNRGYIGVLEFKKAMNELELSINNNQIKLIFERFNIYQDSRFT